MRPSPSCFLPLPLLACSHVYGLAGWPAYFPTHTSPRPLTGSSPAWHMLLLSHNLAYSRAMCFFAFVFLPAVAAATPVAVVVVDAVVTVSLPLCDNSHNERDLGLSYFLVYFHSFFVLFLWLSKCLTNQIADLHFMLSSWLAKSGASVFIARRLHSACPSPPTRGCCLLLLPFPLR